MVPFNAVKSWKVNKGHLCLVYGIYHLVVVVGPFAIYQCKRKSRPACTTATKVNSNITFCQCVSLVLVLNRIYQKKVCLLQEAAKEIERRVRPLGGMTPPHFWPLQIVIKK